MKVNLKKDPMDKFPVVYLALVFAIIIGAVYSLFTEQNDEMTLGLIMGSLFAIVAGIMLFSVRE